MKIRSHQQQDRIEVVGPCWAVVGCALTDALIHRLIRLHAWFCRFVVNMRYEKDSYV